MLCAGGRSRFREFWRDFFSSDFRTSGSRTLGVDFAGQYDAIPREEVLLDCSCLEFPTPHFSTIHCTVCVGFAIAVQSCWRPRVALWPPCVVCLYSACIAVHWWHCSSFGFAAALWVLWCHFVAPLSVHFVIARSWFPASCSRFLMHRVQFPSCSSCMVPPFLDRGCGVLALSGADRVCGCRRAWWGLVFRAGGRSADHNMRSHLRRCARGMCFCTFLHSILASSLHSLLPAAAVYSQLCRVCDAASRGFISV